MKRFVPVIIVLHAGIGLICMRPATLHAQEVVINEFMFAPATGEAEWVELYNPADTPVNLRGWTLKDRSKTVAVLAEEDAFIEAHGFVIVASALPLGSAWEQLPCAVILPSAFPALNNSGDDIVLRAGDGSRVDSLAYSSSWSPSRGISAERIRADAPPSRENWAPCDPASRGTPGTENTAVALRADPRTRGDLIINEIMAAPLPASCEWLELLNTTGEEIALSRWTLFGKADASGTRKGITLPGDAGRIPAGGYAVIAADSSVLTAHHTLRDGAALLVLLDRASLDLGNEGDEIVLVDGTGGVIDSIRYEASWHSPLLSSPAGISLELIHPSFRALGDEAWNSCSDPSGGTPGRKNSVHSDAPPQGDTGRTAITAMPNPFSPDGDGFEDSCLLRCLLPAHVNQVRLRIYDARGRCVATLRNNVPMGKETLVVWDGRDETGNRARIGCYVALLEGLNPARNTVTAAKTVIVVARRL